MPASPRGRRRGPGRTALGAALASLLGSALLAATSAPAAGVVPAPRPTAPAGPAAEAPAGDGDVHIVVLRGRPSAAYLGGFPALARTAPRPGERFDRSRPAVAAHADRLRRQQDRVLAQVDDPEVLYRYTTAVNGFATRLTERQAKQLEALPAVRMVEQARTQRLATTGSADSLGAARAWAAVGGSDRAGRGQVVGVVDSGIWPENPSFAGVPLAAAELPKRLPGFHGTCSSAEEWDTQDCDDKVVAARWFVRGFGSGQVARSEYLSPRDGSGHGSHTAAVAAGNADVRVDVDGQSFGTASGMAPAARIAAYKACWTAPDPDRDGCHTADTLAAVDRAVADGVDVLSYSVSGSGQAGLRALDLAFLNATSAGVFVAAAAGNDGPTAGTVHHGSPWVTTVGASTHHLLQGALVLGDGTRLVGAMVSNAPVRETPLVLASRAAADDTRLDAARRCEAGSLDAAKVRGRVVVCDRGRIARVDKSAAVARAGGAGMVLANTVPGSVDADFHAVPTVHVDAADADRVETYARTAEAPVASFDPDATDDTDVPQVASFSSRGPTEVADGSVLKPDLVAPGVSVLAAVAPPTGSGRLWDLRSGTSMSTPHVAGLAAMLADARPGWSPAQIRSALMTTAESVDDVPRPLAEGAGVPDPVSALEPGITFDTPAEDYRRLLRGSLDVARLNLPSIAVGDLTGTARVVRRVTNVSGSAETFAPQVSGLDDLAVRVRPTSLSLAPGETGRFRVALTAQPGMEAGTVRTGTLTWTGLSHQARIPVAVRSRAVAAPDEVVGEVGDGRIVVDATSGSASPGELRPVGLVAAAPVGLSLTPGDFTPDAPSADADTERFTTSVPPDTALLRVELAGHRATDDMDVHVYRDGEPVATSTTPGSAETVTVVDPEAGDYTVYVRSVSAGNGSTTTGQLYRWVVPDEDASNVALTPARADPGVGDDLGFTLEWGDLSEVSRWFGAVRYGDTGDLTLVSLR